MENEIGAVVVVESVWGVWGCCSGLVWWLDVVYLALGVWSFEAGGVGREGEGREGGFNGGVFLGKGSFWCCCLGGWDLMMKRDGNDTVVHSVRNFDRAISQCRIDFNQ